MKGLSSGLLPPEFWCKIKAMYYEKDCLPGDIFSNHGELDRAEPE